MVTSNPSSPPPLSPRGPHCALASARGSMSLRGRPVSVGGCLSASRSPLTITCRQTSGWKSDESARWSDFWERGFVAESRQGVTARISLPGLLLVHRVTKPLPSSAGALGGREAERKLVFFLPDSYFLSTCCMSARLAVTESLGCHTKNPHFQKPAIYSCSCCLSLLPQDFSLHHLPGLLWEGDGAKEDFMVLALGSPPNAPPLAYLILTATLEELVLFFITSLWMRKQRDTGSLNRLPKPVWS